MWKRKMSIIVWDHFPYTNSWNSSPDFFEKENYLKHCDVTTSPESPFQLKYTFFFQGWLLSVYNYCNYINPYSKVAGDYHSCVNKV